MRVIGKNVVIAVGMSTLGEFPTEQAVASGGGEATGWSRRPALPTHRHAGKSKHCYTAISSHRYTNTIKLGAEEFRCVPLEILKYLPSKLRK
ncbi:hypothetical protein RR46_10816 [Papilio xuthus]|uniref:Uncharacterized protein n=1 Tax=Papilio xuthus TaxID=66420 RepID=A0A194PJF3_PAPXU|nr:hypothetical protein RR46_10816 [Papilio xuthus]